MRNHPGKSMTIYDIPIYDIMVSEALPKSVTPTNISSGFRNRSIQPGHLH